MNGEEWRAWLGPGASAAALERMMALMGEHPDLEVHAPMAPASPWLAAWPEGTGSVTVARGQLHELLDAIGPLLALAAKRAKLAAEDEAALDEALAEAEAALEGMGNADPARPPLQERLRELLRRKDPG